MKVMELKWSVIWLSACVIFFMLTANSNVLTAKNKTPDINDYNMNEVVYVEHCY